MAVVTKVSQGTRPGTWQISLPFQGEEEVVGSYVFAGKDELAVIDPGPSSTAESLLARLREAGFNPQDVTHLLLTHIHLDHAGGVGLLLRSMPQAKIYVHRNGAPHLIDPTRFLASASRIYGNQMQELWGEVLPVPEDRIKALEGGDVLNVAGRRMEVHYTPGHASHHVIFFDVHTGELFAGDVGGVRLQDINYVRAPTPPPDLDVEGWSTSIDKLKQLRPDVLYLAHYGPATNAIPHLEHMREGKNETEITELLTSTTAPDLQRSAGNAGVLPRYNLMSGYQMSVQGYMRYWSKKHPEQL
jgi:glyoxylase-like metal-dependent hydrolase (beta-lactamase superfamily II)